MTGEASLHRSVVVEMETLTRPILDVRSEDAFLRGHIVGSVNIPAGELDGRMYELPEKGTDIAVFHHDPSVRNRVMTFLRERGYVAWTMSEGEFDETGPSGTRLWSPTPLLVEALGHGRWFAGAPAKAGTTCEERAKARTTYEAADLGCGSGREAVYLAMQGWRVDGYDVLPDALDNARLLAERNGVVVNAIQRDLRREPDLGIARYELICMFRFWDDTVFAAAVRALRVGGLVVVEAFAAGDPKRANKLVTSETLAKKAAGLNVQVARELERGGRRFAQLIARKPGVSDF